MFGHPCVHKGLKLKGDGDSVELDSSLSYWLTIDRPNWVESTMST